MSNVEAFMEGVVSDMRKRLAVLDDDGDRRAVEDGIALLTDYRLSNLDEPLFERLLATLRGGRSPVGLSVLRPEVIGAELAWRWQAFTQGGTLAAGS